MKKKTSKKPPARPLTRAEQEVVARAYTILPRVLRPFWRSINSSGMTMEDAVPALCVTLSTRLQGKNPWDPQRGSLEGYLHVLAKTWLANQIKIERRRHRKWSALAQWVKPHRSTISESSLVDPPIEPTMFISRRVITTEVAWDCLQK